jgi:hypothetical protein
MYSDQFSPGVSGILNGLIAVVILLILVVVFRRAIVHFVFSAFRQLARWNADIEDEVERERSSPPQEPKEW